MKLKNLVCVILAAVVGILIVGCNAEEEKEEIINQFTADFEAEYKEMTVRGEVVAGLCGFTKISVTYPETVEGLNVAYRNGEMELGMKSLLSTADEAYLPQESLPQIMRSVISSLPVANEKLASDEEKFTTYITQLAQGRCILKIDEYGFLNQAEIKEQDVVINFFNHMAA